MTTTTSPTRPARLHYTGDDGADRLLAENPLAMLIGFALDQQVTVQKAFAGPGVMLERIGTLDAGAIARMDAGTLEKAFRTPPAIHRFPASMAARVQELCAHVADTYGGDASRVWTEASDGADLNRRLAALPGFGPMKVRTLVRLLSRQYGVTPDGYERYLPDHPTLGDVTSIDELNAYQAGKRAYKAAMRAQAAGSGAPAPAAARARRGGAAR
ncbi:MAG TPA: HhH-GPD-type base excision DNA repair protein [Candidatus Dormibacteraeota bacterium]|nr:HhH-GPD-type base excision DNA repair protein [Candidatus Dormibacteraeota bacterium]